MELCTSKLPRIDVFGAWYIPGFERLGQWGRSKVLFLDRIEFAHHDDDIIKACKDITWTDFCDAGSPLTGNFTNPDDRLLMKPLMETYLAIFHRFYSEHLEPLLQCATWTDVKALPAGVSPQIWDSADYYQSPVIWVEQLLPLEYILMLKNSLTSDIIV